MVKFKTFPRTLFSIRVALACFSLCLMHASRASGVCSTIVPTFREIVDTKTNETIGSSTDPILDLLEQVSLDTNVAEDA